MGVVMKKVIIIFIVFGVTGLVVFLAIAYSKRKKQNEADRIVLGGRTGKEFVSEINGIWESKYKQAQRDWLMGAVPEYQKENINQYFRGWSKWHPLLEYWEFEFTMEEAEQRREDKLTQSVNGSWESGISIFDHEWAYLYWLPPIIDGMKIDWHDSRVQELLRQV